MGVDCLNITSQSQCKFIADKTWTPEAFFNPLLSFFQFHCLCSFWCIISSSFEMNMTPVLCLDRPRLWYRNSFHRASREILHLYTCIYAHTEASTTGEGFASIRNPGRKTPTMMNSQKIHKILHSDSQGISFTKLWHRSHRVNAISL